MCVYASDMTLDLQMISGHAGAFAVPFDCPFDLPFELCHRLLCYA